MTKLEKTDTDYRQWLIDLKTKIRQSQIKAAAGSNQSIGISAYELSNLLPKNYKSAWPRIEEIEEG